MSIPFVYFLITYFYQYILGNLLISYLEIDPITVSIILGAFLALSKPIGGLVFGVAFWKISRIISYERNIMTYMIISGWGIFLIFAANQAATQTIPGSILLLDFNSNCFEYSSIFDVVRNLQFSNHSCLRITTCVNLYVNMLLESKLLGLLGHAELDNEIRKTVKKIIKTKLL